MKKFILMLLLVPMMAMAQNSSNSNDQLAIASVKTFMSYKADVAFERANAKFIGNYKSELIKDFEIDVFVENGKLFAKSKIDSNKIELLQVSPSKFRTVNYPVRIEFMEDGNEVVFMMVVKDEMTWLVKSE
jgi:hypothetical protein